MDKKILASIMFMIVTSGIFASEKKYTISEDRYEGRYIIPKVKKTPPRSSLFEPDYAIEEEAGVTSEEHDLFMEDVEDALVVPVTVKQGSGNYYYSKSQWRPWLFGTMKQRDSQSSYLKTLIMADDKAKLVEFLEGKDLSKINKFEDNPLLDAIFLNKIDAIAPLAAAGADVLMQDRDGVNLIYYAYQEGNPLMVQEFLKAQQKQLVQARKGLLYFRRVSPESEGSVSPFCFNDNSDRNIE